MTPEPFNPAPSDPGVPKPVAGATSDSNQGVPLSPRPVTPYEETVQLQRKTDRRTKSEPSLPDEAAGAPSTARFGKFIRTRRLGAGGMGEVWKAWDTILGRWVALKFLKGGDDDEIARFRREAQTAGRLHHPNIAAIFEVDEDQGRHYIAMQFVDGQTLHTFPRGDRKLLARLAADAARAVHYAHEQGVIHRDLKPENLMVTTRAVAEGKPLEHHLFVMDFGLARLAEGASKLSVSGYVVGTPSYMAPEQARGDKVDARADVYSLGITLYELLTGSRPFESDNVYETLRRVQELEPAAPRRIDPKIAADLETIVLKSVSKEPAGRYSSAQDLAEDLTAFIAGDPIRARRESLSRKIARRVRRHPVAVAAGLLLVAGLTLAWSIAASGSRDKHTANMSRSFQAALDAGAWGKARQRAFELAAMSGVDASVHVSRVRAAMEESVRRDLAAGDLARARATVDDFDRFWPGEAAALRNDVRLRESAWPVVFALEAPYGESKKIFGAAVRVEAARLTRVDGPPAVLTTAPCGGGVELKAEFDAGWTSASSIGLVLNGTPQGGYRFVLSSGTPAPNASPPSFGESREGVWRARIYRNEALVADAPVTATSVLAGGDATLRLLAKREGDRLSFQVNDRRPEEASDPFAVGMGRRGTYGVIWPLGAGLRRLVASHRDPPQKPNPLEAGDDLFVQGRFEEALQAYRGAALNAASPFLREEARYKEGLCELQCNREEAGVQAFQEVVAGFLQKGKSDDTRWLFMAESQLLGYYFRQKDGIERATEILDRLKLYDYPFEKIALLMPPDVQGAILYNTLSGSVGQNLHRRPEDHLARSEFSVKASQLLEPAGKVPDYKWHALMRAQMVCGQTVEAKRTAERMFREFQFGGDWLDDYCWMLRIEGQPEAALQAIERGVPGHPAHLVERARIRAALGRWDEARADLLEYLKSPEDYHAYSGAALLLGFVLEQKGAPAAEVEETWRKGLLKNWTPTAKDRKTDFYEKDRTPLGMAMLHHWIMASLSGEMTDADAEQLLSGLIAFGGKDNPVFNRLMRPSVLRATWRTPRGREVARQLALRSVPFSDAVRYPLFVGWIAFAHEVCFPPEPLSADQDEAIWRMAIEIYDAYRSGLVNERFFLPFGAIVQGKPNSPGMGWKEVAKLLEKAPRLRGPLGYLFGQRYAKLKDGANAELFFKSALYDSGRDGGDGLLKKLAQAELDRLGSK